MIKMSRWPQNLIVFLFRSLLLYQPIFCRETGVKTYCDVTLTKTTDFQNGKTFEMKIKSTRIILEIHQNVPERWNYPIFLQIHSSNKTVVKTEYKIPRKFLGRSKNYKDINLVGFLKDNYFHGMIQFKEQPYFIDEPFDEELREIDTLETRMYGYQGIEYTEETLLGGTIAFTHVSNVSVRYECPVLIPKSGWLQPEPKKQIIVKNILHLCSLELVADPTFYNEFGPGEDKVFLKMYKHIAIADSLMRRTDFDFNGVPDGIGVIVRKVTIYKDWHCLPPNYLTSNDDKTVADDYLKHLAKRPNTVCLLISFCHLSFKEAVVGVAYVPNIEDPAQLGGICERGTVYTDIKSRRMNVVAISTRSSSGKRLPDTMTTSTVIHEIGHAFGSSHDDDKCGEDPGKGGPYIMHPHTLEGYQSNNFYFSPCSRRQIQRVIRARRGCLETNHTDSWCGNGVKEMGEECDCGIIDLCHILDPCCNQPGIKGCTYKKDFGYECSYKTDQCCTELCKIEREGTSRPCQYQQGLCRIPNICDGTSQFCPTNSTLNQSKCEAVACIKAGLKTCFCAEDDCKVCCQSNKGCGNLIIGGHAVFLPEGSLCWGGNGTCDYKGVCYSDNSRYERHWTFKYFVPLLIFITIISIVCALPFLCKYLNRFRGGEK